MTGRRYSDQQLVQALTHAQTMSDVLRALGLAPRGGNYENVRAHINRLGMTEPVWVGCSAPTATR